MKYLKQNGYPSTNPMGVICEELYTDFVMYKDLNMVWRCVFIVGPCGEMIEFLQDISK